MKTHSFIYRPWKIKDKSEIFFSFRKIKETSGNSLLNLLSLSYILVSIEIVKAYSYRKTLTLYTIDKKTFREIFMRMQPSNEI